MGFGNGSVTIIRGDLIHDRGARQRIVFESEEPITGLEVQSGVLSTLFISTTSRILTLVISGRGQGQPARVLDDSGCGVGCMALDRDTGDIVVAREDAIYTYGPHGRGRHDRDQSSIASPAIRLAALGDVMLERSPGLDHDRERRV